MNPVELVELIKRSNPRVLGKVPDKRAAAIIRAAMQGLVAKIKATDEGEVKVPGLGRFVVKRTEREKDGHKIVDRRIVFRTHHKPASRPR